MSDIDFDDNQTPCQIAPVRNQEYLQSPIGESLIYNLVELFNA